MGRHMKLTPDVNVAERRAYEDAKSRCRNKRHQFYYRYGAQGIEFHFTSFKEFLNYIGEKPIDWWYSLDRIDNNGPYAIGNVRWATHTQQSESRKRIELAWPFPSPK